MYQALPALPYCKRRKAGRGTGNEAIVSVHADSHTQRGKYSCIHSLQSKFQWHESDCLCNCVVALHRCTFRHWDREVIVSHYSCSTSLRAITFNWHLGILTQAVAHNGFLYTTVPDPFGYGSLLPRPMNWITCNKSCMLKTFISSEKPCNQTVADPGGSAPATPWYNLVFPLCGTKSLYSRTAE